LAKTAPLNSDTVAAAVINAVAARLKVLILITPAPDAGFLLARGRR
jgi:hypothetical protein